MLRSRRSRVLLGVGAAIAVLACVVGVYLIRKADSARADAAAKVTACREVTALETRVASQRAAAAQGSGPLIAFLGDSYAEGFHTAAPMRAFPYLVGNALNRPVLVNAVGGSGFLSPGPCNDAPYASRIGKVLAAHPATLVLEGGINDRGRGDEAAAATRLIRRVPPDVRVVVVGPCSVPQVAGGPLDTVASDLRKAATTAHVPFVDCRAIRVQPVRDGLHPDPASEARIAEVVAAAIRKTG